MSMAKVIAPHPDASGLSALRVLKNGRGRFYSAVSGSWRLIEQTLRQARSCGLVEDAGHPERYAVLDVLNDDGEIIQDYVIPNAAAWRWWKRKLGLRVVAEED